MPIPYPNVSFSSSLANGTVTVLADGGNSIAHRTSEFASSTGDEPGTLGGVSSGTFTKEAKWLTFSPTVRFEGQNACRLTDKMTCNHGNTVSLGGEMQIFLDILQTLGELAMLCEIICYCELAGKEACVADTLLAIDEAMGGLSTLEPEVPYNMMTSPPSPLMSTTDPRRGSTNWRYPSHPSYPEGFEPGQGLVRRPDVVLRSNPLLPPSGDNLRAVVEIKFPPDSWDTADMLQRRVDYARIAVENSPTAIYIELDPQICGCEDGTREPEPVPVEQPEPVPVPVEEEEPVELPSPPPLGLPAPSPGLLDGLLGLGEMVVGGVGVVAGTVGSGALVLDDATGVGILDDPLVPVTAGVAVGGGVLFVDGWRRVLGSLGF